MSLHGAAKAAKTANVYFKIIPLRLLVCFGFSVLLRFARLCGEAYFPGAAAGPVSGELRIVDGDGILMFSIPR